MSRLSLYLLGAPRIERDGEPVQVNTRKAIALLAYLALTGERHTREMLLSLLWPEYDPSRGRAALRSTLYALRKALGGDWLEVDRESVGLGPRVSPSRPGQAFWLDVDAFRGHLARCHTHGHPPSDVCPACLPPLTDAVALYRDDFMRGFSLRDSLNFDDWQFYQADALRREFAGALERLVRCHIAQGTFEPAIPYARRWLALDRLEEAAHVQLMRLYAWSGQRSAALRQYEECARVLESQLSVSPQAATTELYHAIRSGQAIQGGRAAGPPQTQTSSQAQRAPEPPQAALSEEKRMLTVVYTDASRSLAERQGRGPEDVAALLERFLQAMAEVVSRHGGQIVRTLGGGVLSLFGAAQTHESDPERAARAAVETRQQAAQLGLSPSIGISTGQVYLKQAGAVRDEGQAPLDVATIGAAVDRAVRLAGRAGAGQILVDRSTHRLTRRAFGFTPLALEAEGAHGAPSAYQVERLLPRPEKPRGIEGLRAELVGRDGELAKLREALAQVVERGGQMVSLTGEAGVGKSRLVAELKQIALASAAEPAPLWLEGRCLELGTAAGYAPFVDILSQYFAWGAREADRRRYERITSGLQELAARGDLAPERIGEIAPLLANLLSLRTGDAWEQELRALDPEQIRRRTFAAVRDFLFALARQRPVVLAFEDLHWADSLSIDLISLLMEGLHLGPLLLLCAYRPEREHRCGHLGTIAAGKCRGRYTELRLCELTPTQSRRLLASLLRIEDEPAPAVEFILERCQGSPFFIEEAVLSLIDAGIALRHGDAWRAAQGIVPTAVPTTVQSVILSRVDRLDDELRYVLRIASAIGRVFRRRVLERAMQREVDLERALWELEDRALIYQERTIPEVEYSFRHVLAQETVYQSILRERQQTYHRYIAEAIQALYPDNLDEYKEQLAHHHERSGNVQAAIVYLLQAGVKATRSYANEEAVAHVRRGLELLKTLPETPERARQELELQLALGVPLVPLRGQSAPQVGEAYKRALELCDQVGEAPQQFHALVGLRRFHFVRGELQAARGLAERLVSVAEQAKDPFLLSVSRIVEGGTLYWLGGFTRAREALSQGIASYDLRRHPSHATLYGADIAVGAQLYLALLTWLLGYPDQALETGRQTLAQVQQASDPFTRVYAHHLVGMLYQVCRKARAVQELAERMLDTSREHEIPFYSAAGLTLRGWALAVACPDPPARARAEEGIGQIREGISGWKALEPTVMLPYSLAYLAEAYTQAGRVQEGLDALNEALEIVETTGCRTWEAELYRLKGELLWATGCEGKTEACFQRAIEVSQRQRARSWELRAVTSLGRVWQEHGKRKKAADLIQRAYGWFTEGLGTTDLQEARSLLDALA